MGKPVILCVDDESVVLDSLKIQLKKAFQDEYFYETTESADEALEIIEEYEEEETELIVIVSDWLMPGIKGDEFLIQVHQKFPHVVKILLTGQANEDAIERAKTEAKLHRYIPKPWNAEELVESIKSGLKTIDN
ncbi:response regulator [Spirulina sp. CS-785/01]|uniref:response regulator n=1 Tax=Spirulina sp. CS-785/01 TaxID=3021716 RepID=UPI00232CBE56|nr:response regulator [Spirulina sp. CS-785/01]MDB9312617.1 response regulator [Spirulina sp. CS-785/01]